MYVNAVVSPALGKTTVLNASREIRFNAVLELSTDHRYAEDGWSLELWYGAQGKHWQAAPFSLAKDNGSNLEVIALGSSVDTSRHAFALDLDVTQLAGSKERIDTEELSHTFQFTLRFRPTPEAPWIWMNEHAGLPDGQIILGSWGESLDQTPFKSLFSDSDAGLTAQPVISEVTGVDVFDVSASAPANGWHSVVLGQPLLLEKFYALVKLSNPWMGPRHGSSHFEIDSDGLMVGYLRSDGRHVVVLGMSALDNCTTYLQSNAGNVVMKTRNDGSEPQSHRVVVATGIGDYQRVSNAAFYRARDLLRCAQKQKVIPAPEPASWHQTWFDGLTYCTWNSLGRELTEERILSALQDLSDNGISVSTLIIDDNWQSLDENGLWMQFEANSNFPQGLAHTTAEVRRRFPNIKHIAVWHSLIGYWDGIAPNSPIDRNYKCVTIKWHGGQDVRVVDPSDIDRFYDDFYAFLEASGVDAVKCDDQMAIDEFDEGLDRLRIGVSHQDAMKKSSIKHFSRRVIYCMCHVPSILFHSLLPHDGVQTFIRNSDDFFPDIPDSHPWHIMANAMNSIFTSNLNSLPDWDMFQTTLPQYASYHAAARCISGGPIYITDSPGQHDAALIKLLTAVSPQGQTVILRPTRAALPADPFVGFNQNRLLKLRNFAGGYRGNSLLAVFNVSEAANTEVVAIDDFTGIVPDSKYVVRSHKDGAVASVGYAGKDTIVTLTLQKHDWDFFTAVPVEEVQLSRKGKIVQLACFGLISALSGAAAVQHVEISSSRVGITATLKALGILGFYISDLPERELTSLFVLMSDVAVPLHTVARNALDGRVLEVDIERAWTELGLSAGQSDEVVVKLFVS